MPRPQSHYRSDIYGNTFSAWCTAFRHSFVLLALLVVFILFAAASLVRAEEAAPTQDQSHSPTDQVIALINEQRLAHGCPALTPHPLLAAAAQGHAEDMAVRNYLNHTTPEGVTFSQRISNTGYAWSHAAENILVGLNAPDAIVATWMSSPDHRSNILDCTLTEVAVGVAYQADDGADVVFPDGSIGGPFYYYWVMDLATPAGQ